MCVAGLWPATLKCTPIPTTSFPSGSSTLRGTLTRARATLRMWYLALAAGTQSSHSRTCTVLIKATYRVCPGRYFAESSLFIFAAAFLHAFNVSPPLDAQGKPTKLHHNMMTAGIVA